MGSTEDLLAATATQSGEGIAEIRSRTMASLQVAREKLDEIQENAWSRAKEAASMTDEYVHENPWTAIGVGAGASLLLGLLVSRR